MPSQFEETLRRAREKGEAKLKIIAPKFTPAPGPSFGRPTSKRPTSGRRRRRSSSSSKAAAEKAAAEKAAASKAAATKATAAKSAAAKRRSQEARVLQAKLTGKTRAAEVQRVGRERGFIANKIRELEDLQKLRATKSIRTKQKNLRNELELIGLTVGTAVVRGVIGLATLPKTLIDTAKDPARLKKVPSAIRTSAEEFGQLVRISPTEAFAKIGGEIVFLKGSGKALEVVGKVTGKAANKLDPFIKRVDEGKINLKVPETPKRKPAPEKPGKIPPKTPPKIGIKQGKRPRRKKKKITLELGVIGKGTPLAKQAKLAGKKLDVVASVQTQSIINFIRNKQKVIMKPIPGEETLKRATKLLLKKFDSGSITKKQLFDLNKKLIRETGDKTLLERSLFADPTGKIRFTRLADEPPTANLVDILSGDFTFKTPKPQILVFTDVPVAKFPKNLRDVAKKLKSGKTLTENERIRLVEWQVKKSGKLKPVGDVKFKGGKELEVTVAPGELIRRKRGLGTTVIDGKRVKIVEVEIFKPTGNLKKQLSEAKKGNLNKAELKKLEKTLEKKTGIKTKSIKPSRRRRGKARPKARLPKRVPGRVRPKTRRKPKRPAKRPAKRPPKRPPVKRAPKRPPKRPVKRPPKRPVKRPLKRPPRGPPRVPPKAPPRITTRRKRRPKRKPKQQKSYDVFARPIKRTKKAKRPKLIKVNKVPLTKSRARDVRNYVADTSLARTARIKPAKGKPKKSNIKVPKGYAKKTSAKFRTHRIVKGKRKPLPKGKVIERRTKLLDTRQEKKKITLRGRIRQITPKKKTKRKPIKRKATKRRR